MKNTGLSAGVLKNIACVTMLIDHTAVVFLESSSVLCNIMRFIGRMAFILYAYLLAEGFRCTHDRAGYLKRLLMFAVISEIPFDLMVSHRAWSLDHQNVLITLSLGFCAIWITDSVCRNRRPAISALIWLITALVFGLAATTLRSDYSCMGVWLIMIFYIFRYDPVLLNLTALPVIFFGQFFVRLFYYLPDMLRKNYSIKSMYSFIVTDNTITLAITTLIGCGISLILIAFYNGKKGRQLPKPFYYAFYPVHMSLLMMLYAFSRLIWPAS